MNVLNLVTNTDARCFDRQVAVLEGMGIDTATLSPPGTHEHTADGPTHRSPADYLRFYPTVLRHSFGEYDLVHANYGLTGPMAVAQPNLPVVLSLWGSDLFGEYGWLSKTCARFADAVIVMSEVMADELGTECHVIPHGIDTDLFAPRSTAEAKAELGWDPDVKHVLFPYTKEREVKDFPRAERVVDRAAERYDGSVSLEWITGVPYETMPTYMNAADVLIMTSKHEGSPSTVKEALACNLPVVSTDVGDVAERLDGVSPSFVGETDREIVDGLVRILEADARSNGRETAEEMSLDRMGEQLREVYASVTRG